MTQSKKTIKSAVDIVIFTVADGVLKFILIEMKKKPFTGMWAFPGGLIGEEESLDNAARRELGEKTGVKNVYLEQLYTFSDPKRDPNGRVISTAYFALVNSAGLKLKTSEKYSGIDWFPTKRLPTLAYDHKEIAKYAIQRLQWKLEYTNIAYSLLPKKFTLSQLREIYEVILDRELDRRNFQRKVRALGLLKSTRKRRIGKHRPARLYEFKSRKPAIMEVL
jgi:8-oxo-dGTP diphosphatase